MKRHNHPDLKFAVFFLVITICFFACTAGNKDAKNSTVAGMHFFHKTKDIQVALQPFNDISPARAKYVFDHVKAVYSNTIILPPVPLPAASWYAPRSRYKADSIIRWLSVKAKTGQVMAGITTKDISTAKGEVKDYGVMGLGYTPGNACAISTFRLKKGDDNQLYKVVLHELGHTQGLPHCRVKTCIMRDAEGHNTTDEETGFCPACKQVLISKGWVLK